MGSRIEIYEVIFALVVFAKFQLEFCTVNSALLLLYERSCEIARFSGLNLTLLQSKLPATVLTGMLAAFPLLFFMSLLASSSRARKKKKKRKRKLNVQSRIS